MTNTYQTMITDIGAAKLAAAIATGIPLIVTTAAVGDGGGADYNPTPAQSALRHEVWRGAVAYSEIDREDPKMLNIHFIIPPDAGGFTVREAGLFDEVGTLLAVCNLPATKKELYTSGTTGKLTIIMHIVVADAGAVEVVIQPNLDTVTRDQLLEVTTAAVAEHGADMSRHTSAEEKAKTAADIAGLAEGKLSISQNIPEAADLNDYYTAGMYWYVGDYTNLQNRPPVPSVSFSLLVEKTGAYGTGVAQTATYYHDASRWVRTINDVNVWTAWEQLANMNDIANKTSTMATITQAKFDDLNITTSYVASVNPTIANMPEPSYGVIMGYAYAADTSSANGAQEIITSNNTRYYRKAVNGTVSPWMRLATAESQQLILLNGWTHSDSYTGYMPVAYKSGTIVNVSGNIDHGVKTSQTVIAYLPVHFYPKNSTYIALNDTTTILVRAHDGAIVIVSPPSSSRIYLNFSFGIGG